MNDEIASDEVTDAIAHIEMHRQESVKESGLAHACAEALRKLNELLEQVRAETQQTLPQGARSPNLEAVTQEIRKVKSLAGNAGHHDTPRPARPKQPQQQQQPSRGGPHGQPRNKGRRSMGRSNGR
jgi:hypothetical protein